MFESGIFSKLTGRGQVELFEDKQQLIYHGLFRLVADLPAVDQIPQPAPRNWRYPRVMEPAARIADSALSCCLPHFNWHRPKVVLEGRRPANP